MSTESQPLVSVMVVSYNQEAFVAEALQSALDQDYENLQVVISDDASTDRTQEIIADFQKRYPKRLVALLNKKNVGVTRNCNQALKLCTGELISFHAGDDVFLPGKITAQVEWFKGHPERVLCGHQVEVFYQSGTPAPHPLTETMPEGTGASWTIRNGVPYGALSIMVRASAIPPHGFEEALPVVSDHMMWIEVLAAGGTFGYLDKTYGRYRKHDSNVTRQHLKNLQDFRKTLELTAQRYPQYREDCDFSLTHHVLYGSGVLMLKAGDLSNARRHFLQAIRRQPSFWKPWVRLVQSFVPLVRQR